MGRWRWEVGALVTAVALRTAGVLSQPVTTDEAFTLDAVRLPIGQMLDFLAHQDTHPPLHYLLVWVTSRATAVDLVALRVPSVVLGLLTVAVIGLVGDRFGGARVRRAAFWIAALSPVLVRLSRWGRGYALLAFGAALALLGLVDWIQAARGGRSASRGAVDGERSGAVAVDRGRTGPILFAVGSAVAVLTHHTGLFVVAGAVAAVGLLGMVGQLGEDWRWRTWGVAVAAVVGVWLTWLPAFLTQAGEGARLQAWVEPLTPRRAVGTLRTAWSDFRQSGRAGSSLLARGAWTWGWWDALVLGMAGAGARKAWASGRREVLVAGGVLVAFPLLGFGWSVLRSPINLDRAAVVLVPSLVALVAVGWVDLRDRRPVVAVLVAGVGVAVMATAVVTNGQVSPQ